MPALVAVLLLLALAAPAMAADPQPLPPSMSATLTDGDEHALSHRADGFWLLSERVGQEVRLEVPADCVQPSLGAATLAFWCRDSRSLRLYDIRTGIWTRQPDPEDAIKTTFGSESGFPSLTVGRAWMQLYGGPDCYHCDDWVVRLSRELGEYGPEDPETRRVYENLDHPRLWVPLCSPLRRMPNAHYDPSEFSAFRYWDPIVLGRRAIDFDRHDRPRLRRCGRREGKLLTRSRHAQLVHAGGGFVTWLQQDSAAFETDRGHVVAYEIATGRKRRWRVPGPAGRVAVTHTRRRLFIDKIGESGRASRRYSVMLRR